MRKYSTLVELSRDYIREHISKDEFKEAVKEIEIFQPIEDDVDDTVYYNGNKNSWFEVKAYLKLTDSQLKELIQLERGEL